MWQYGEDVWGGLSLQGRPPLVLLVLPAVVKQEEEEGTASQPPSRLVGWLVGRLYFQ